MTTPRPPATPPDAARLQRDRETVCRAACVAAQPDPIPEAVVRDTILGLLGILETIGYPGPVK